MYNSKKAFLFSEKRFLTITLVLVMDQSLQSLCLLRSPNHSLLHSLNQHVFFCSTPSLFGVSYTLILSPPSHFVFPILFYVLVHSLYHVRAFTTIFIVFFALFFISLDIGNTWLINFNYYKIIYT